MNWEDCVLADGQVAEFPVDLLTPIDSSNGVEYVYWDNKPVVVKSIEDYLVCPTNTYDEMAQPEMELKIKELGWSGTGIKVTKGDQIGFLFIRKN